MVVFCVLVLGSCAKEEGVPLELIYDGDKAVALSFLSTLGTKDAKVYVQGNLDTPMLGDFSKRGHRYTFEPVVPFTEGNTYLLYNEGKEIAKMTIRSRNDAIAPEVIAVYPSANVLPENLLKMYFLFSKPMQEVADALSYISIIDYETNEEVEVFLELPTELCNKEHTQLTLWLDPGRIKTDLIPNKEKGLPIVKGKSYTLRISQDFRDAKGAKLQQAYVKEFRVGARDTQQPQPMNWDLEVSLDALIVYFKEPMDAIVALESFSITNSKNEKISGDFELSNEEKTLKFHPKHPFALGTYTLHIESRLEDLAGNNLNHPFDTDLTNVKKQVYSTTKERVFIVE